VIFKQRENHRGENSTKFESKVFRLLWKRFYKYFSQSYITLDFVVFVTDPKWILVEECIYNVS